VEVRGSAYGRCEMGTENGRAKNETKSTHTHKHTEWKRLVVICSSSFMSTSPFCSHQSLLLVGTVVYWFYSIIGLLNWFIGSKINIVFVFFQHKLSPINQKKLIKWHAGVRRGWFGLILLILNG
jgi:hypothetical protein